MSLWMLLLALQNGAQVFLSEEDAARVIFSHGEKVVARDLVLSTELHAAVENRLKRRVENRYRAFVGVREGEPTGVAVITEETTKTLTMTFIVGVDLQGRVTDVAVLEHKEKIGADCAKRKFLDQLVGKTLADPIRRKKDMLHVVGATMSCDAVMRGTRKVLAVVQEAFLDRPADLREIAQEAEPAVQQRYVMGSLCTITAYGPKAAVNQAFDELKRIDGILSNYKDDSELTRLNREGKVRPSAELAEFLRECLRYGDLSDGALDVTVAPLVKLWGFFDQKHRVPTREEIETALQRVGREKIVFEDSTVRLIEGAEIDSGAVGKGFGVDRAVSVLKQAGIASALVDFGSTVYALGAPPGKDGWAVAIRDPFQTDRTLGSLTIHDASVSTSGDYEKRFEEDGKKYGHILDPRTGRPVEGVASVSVLASSATASDALSTAIFVSGLDLAVKAKVEAFVVPADPESESRMTEGWAKRFRRN